MVNIRKSTACAIRKIFSFLVQKFSANAFSPEISPTINIIYDISISHMIFIF